MSAIQQVLAALKGATANIQYVGGQVGSRAGSTSTTSITFALTGGLSSTPQDGDLVLITSAVGKTIGSPDQTISGYTGIGQVNYGGPTYGVSINVSWKFMTSTPDTTFTLPSSGSTSNAQCYTVQVFRGVNATPMDVTATTGNSSPGYPNPPSITPVTPGAWIVVCGAGAEDNTTAFTGPTGYTANFLTTTQADTNDCAIGSGYKSTWTSGAENPAAYTGTDLPDPSVCFSIALRPA